MTNRRQFLAQGAAVAAAAAVSTSSRARGFPTRGVKLVVPQAPGGTTDVVGRAIAGKLGEVWGQYVVVENVVGAAGNLGTQHVARAEPDGYTLLMAYEGSQTMNPNVIANTPFDPVKDFTAIATVARAPFLFVAGPKTPVSTFRELLALAREKPDAIAYGSAGFGTANHLVGEMLKARAGVKILHVPYRGASQAISDVIGGQIETAVVSLPSVIGQLGAGTIKPLVITSARRSPVVPNVPTASESGVDGFDVTPWWGLLGPAGMAPELTRKITADVNDLLKSEDLTSVLQKQGAEPFRSTSEAFSELIAADVAKWATVVGSIALL